MRKTMLALAAASMTIPVVSIPTAADAQTYRGTSYNSTYCRKRSGTTGTVVGAVGGGLLGHAVGGNTTGTLIGAGAGALLGRQIERKGMSPKCYRYRR